MIMSQSIAALSAALAKAQAEMPAAPKQSINPHFKSKYADLAAIMDTCRQPLTRNGLAVMQTISGDGARVEVTTILSHSSGEYIGDTAVFTPRDPSPQAMGSAITYARRYSLSALVGVVADEDDDGNAAQGKSTHAAQANRTSAPAAAPSTAPESPAAPLEQPGSPAEAHRRQQILDAIIAELTKRWPGKDAPSKKAKADALKLLFGTPTWSQVMTKPTEELEEALSQLLAPEVKDAVA